MSSVFMYRERNGLRQRVALPIPQAISASTFDSINSAALTFKLFVFPQSCYSF